MRDGSRVEAIGGRVVAGSINRLFVEEGRPQAAFLGFAPEGAKQTLLLGAYIPMTPTMNGIQAAMISTRAIEGTMPVLNMSPKV